MSYLKLEYWDSCDFGGLVYQLGYKNVMYLDVDVGTPTIEVIEEGSEDGDKNFVTFWKKMIKSYKFFMPVPEYQFDALNFAAMHDSKEITLRNGEKSRCLTFNVENKGWDNNGANVQVEISFSVDYITKSNCCQDKIEYSRCAACQKTLSGIIVANSAQYNDPIANGILVNRYYMVYSTITGLSTLMFLGDKDLLWRDVYDWDYVCYGTYKWYLTGTQYKIYQYLTSSVAGLVANLQCYCLPNSYAQLYVSDNGGAYTATGSPVWYTLSVVPGINYTMTAGHNYKFKFYLFNNNCNYGYSNEVTISA